MGSDSRSVTFKLKLAGFFEFVAYGIGRPPIIPCDAGGNEKSEFFVNDEVYIKFAIKNTGNKSTNASIQGIDDQGETVFSAGTSYISPGSTFKSSAAKLMKLMPNRDWSVTFTVSP